VSKKNKDYEIGYGKPPKSAQFRKGISGNPTGRPKKPIDFDERLLRAADAKVVVNEHGVRRKLTKHDVVIAQLLNKSMKGEPSAMRILFAAYRQASEKVTLAKSKYDAEEEKWSDPKNLTDEELTWLITSDPETRKALKKRRQSQLIDSEELLDSEVGG
jgi:hypothetical protein